MIANAGTGNDRSTSRPKTVRSAGQTNHKFDRKELWQAPTLRTRDEIARVALAKNAERESKSLGKAGCLASCSPLGRLSDAYQALQGGLVDFFIRFAAALSVLSRVRLLRELLRALVHALERRPIPEPWQESVDGFDEHRKPLSHNGD
jgi:hypothetical protein